MTPGRALASPWEHGWRAFCPISLSSAVLTAFEISSLPHFAASRDLPGVDDVAVARDQQFVHEVHGRADVVGNDLGPVADLSTAIVALICGAVVAAVFGTSLFRRLSDERLERLILGLLLIVGVALIAESFLLTETGRFLPDGRSVDIAAGILFGLGIGLVSSLLGVAGSNRHDATPPPTSTACAAPGSTRMVFPRPN